MGSLVSNAQVFSRINVPKYLFLFSKNLSSLINFGMTFVVFMIFCLIDGVSVTLLFLMLIVPVLLLIVFNIGVGLILSAMYVFFRDVQYLWGVFLTLLMYLSAIFYDPGTMTILGFEGDKLLMLNPVYTYISYFREIVLDGIIPSWQHHLLAVGFAFGAFGIGALIYKKMNHKFLYYI